MKNNRVMKKVQDSQRVVVIVVVVVLILIGVYFLLRKNGKLNKVLGVNEGFQNGGNLNNLNKKPDPNPNQVILVLFYVDWCPHCVSTKPEFAKVVQQMNNQNVNGKNVKVHACNCEGSQVEQEVAKENNIQGYPTVKLIKNSEVLDYNGARNAEEMMEFVKSNCN